MAAPIGDFDFNCGGDEEQGTTDAGFDPMSWFEGAPPQLAAEVASGVQALVDEPSLLSDLAISPPTDAQVERAVSHALRGARERARWRAAANSVLATRHCQRRIREKRRLWGI